MIMMMMIFIAALARFCESIVDYVANAENAPYPDITIDRFYGEISAAFDVLFNVWIKSNEAKVISLITGLVRIIYIVVRFSFWCNLICTSSNFFLK